MTQQAARTKDLDLHRWMKAHDYHWTPLDDGSVVMWSWVRHQDGSGYWESARLESVSQARDHMGY